MGAVKMIIIILALTLMASAQIRINCGGLAVTDTNGVAWAADQFFVGGIAFNGPLTEPLGTVRYSALPFSYSIPALPGNYTLNLIFQEEFVTSPGARVFNVAVNGVPFLTGLDVFATAGTGKYIATLPVASTGMVQIYFSTVVRSALVNAIELIPVPVVPPSVLSMVKETWIFIPVAANPPGTAGSPSTFQISFDPNPATLVNVFLNGLLQSSLHAPWDYLLLSTSPPTIQILNPAVAHPTPSIPQFPQVVTVEYWTTKSPATEILH